MMTDVKDGARDAVCLRDQTKPVGVNTGGGEGMDCTECGVEHVTKVRDESTRPSRIGTS
jgi:uncharacterized ferredoxin-like protein